MTLLMRDQENIDKGVEQGIVGVILNMRRKNVPLGTISELTGQSVEWIEEMLKKYETVSI